MSLRSGTIENGFKRKRDLRQGEVIIQERNDVDSNGGVGFVSGEAWIQET